MLVLKFHWTMRFRSFLLCRVRLKNVFVISLIIFIFISATIFREKRRNSGGKKHRSEEDAFSTGHRVNERPANHKNITDDAEQRHVREVLEYRKRRFLKASQRSKTNIRGLGEGGNPVALTKDEEKLAEILLKREHFNIVASDKMAYDRQIRDTRPAECRGLKYPADLPEASVVIVFCNEATSVLLRTVHSVVNRTPPQLLREVILVDDFSDRDELKDLQTTVAESWPDGVVRLVRSNERLGLIRAKMKGADEAKGEVLVFLDAHCEANVQWLEPLLARIAEDRSAVVCPIIDPIDPGNMYYGYGMDYIGGFTWSLHFDWYPQTRRPKSPTSAIRSPAMAGGLFAIDRNYFYQMGTYDPGMNIWGGENLEMSFRVWMCGGSIEFMPCSRVGHLFRTGRPYIVPDGKDTNSLNIKRVAEVWMDEYKRLFYLFRPDLVDINAGNVSDRILLRQKLGCKSFKWYLDNIYPQKFVVDKDVLAYGRVRNAISNHCLDTFAKHERTNFDIGLFYCQPVTSGNQVFFLTRSNQLRRENSCLVSRKLEGQSLSLEVGCSDSTYFQWVHNRVAGTVVNVGSGFCLEAIASEADYRAVASKCSGLEQQKWEFGHYVDL